MSTYTETRPLDTSASLPPQARSVNPVNSAEMFLAPLDPYRNLGLDDIPMLSQLAARTIKYTELPQASVDYARGSNTLIPARGIGNDDRLEHNRLVLSSREAFYYGFLGFEPKQLGYTSHDRPAPIDVFVAGARTYFSHGINPRKLVIRGDRALRTAPEFIDDAVKEVATRGLNHVRFFENAPMTGTLRPDILRGRIAYFLDEVHVSPKKLEEYSSVTARSEKNNRERELVFKKWGQDGRDIGRKFLRVYSLSPENIDATFQTLHDLGIRPDTVARYPSLSGNSTDFITQRVRTMDAHMKDIGFVTSGAEVLDECPIYFGAHSLKITAFMTLMKQHKDARRQLLPDTAKMFKRYERAPIRSLMANVILDGYFGLNKNRNGVIDEAQVVADAIVDPAKLQAIGRPSVVAYINYACKANPQERDRILQITEQLAV